MTFPLGVWQIILPFNNISYPYHTATISTIGIIASQTFSSLLKARATINARNNSEFPSAIQQLVRTLVKSYTLPNEVGRLSPPIGLGDNVWYQQYSYSFLGF